MPSHRYPSEENLTSENALNGQVLWPSVDIPVTRPFTWDANSDMF